MLSAIVIAKNEEHTIRRCLESLNWVDEIIVVDSGSHDKTVAIAREFTDKVYETDWQGYGVQKQRALSYATGDWVLNIDADETVSVALKQTILKTLSDNVVDASRVPIQMYFYDKPLRFSSSPKRHIRLFKRVGASYSNDIVHEKIVLPIDAKVSRLKTPLLHHSFRDVSHVLDKINRYSSYSAKIKIKNNRQASLIKTMLGTVWMFVRCYVVQGGFMDGKEGLIFAIFNAQGTFCRGVKHMYHDVALEALPKTTEDVRD